MFTFKTQNKAHTLCFLKKINGISMEQQMTFYHEGKYIKFAFNISHQRIHICLVWTKFFSKNIKKINTPTCLCFLWMYFFRSLLYFFFFLDPSLICHKIFVDLTYFIFFVSRGFTDFSTWIYLFLKLALCWVPLLDVFE